MFLWRSRNLAGNREYPDHAQPLRDFVLFEKVIKRDVLGKWSGVCGGCLDLVHWNQVTNYQRPIV